MFLRTLMISVLFFVIFSTCDSVILRPRWYPYFRKEGESQTHSGQAQLSLETLGARQARTVSREPCQDDLYDQKCNKLILMAINKLLRDNNQE